MSEPLWWGDDPVPSMPSRSPLEGDAAADVVIVGGGYTGLWTAYYLLTADPSLSVRVLEAEHVGFGASGRNGGWVSALYPVSPETIARRHGEPGARALLAALRESVDEVGRVAAAEGIDCAFHRGGSLVVARSEAQVSRAHAEVSHSRHWGTDTVWLDEGHARERLCINGVRGATFTPHCARVQPYALVRGLAEASERRGAVIHEHTRVASIEPGRVRTTDGAVVTARHVIRATEAWTTRLPSSRRAVVPVYSLVVATAPLPAAVWDDVGLRGYETFSEHRHLIVYGQRTADDRLVFGGRGAPYHFGSGIDPAFDTDEPVHAGLRAMLREMLPTLGDVEFTHAWGGALGIARDWHPSVAHDPETGMGRAGGYVGDGVALTNLAGRTLAELVTERHTALSSLPWVGHRSRGWEPEPWRWLGVNAGLRLATLADQEETRTGRPSRLGPLLSALTGH